MAFLIFFAIVSASSADVDARQVRRIGLRHLLGAVAQRHDPRRRTGNQRLGQREEAVRETGGGDLLREIVVEFLRDIARQLQMLLLVLAHGHRVRAVGQNVGRHQHGVDVEPDAGVLAVLAGLLLELRHAVEPAHPRHAVQNPRKLRMGAHLALVENNVLLGIDARRDEGRRDLARRFAQVRRVLPDGDRVQIHDAVDAGVRLLQRHELGDGAQIVAEMEIAGRLNAGKNALRCAHWIALVAGAQL